MSRAESAGPTGAGKLPRRASNPRGAKILPADAVSSNSSNSPTPAPALAGYLEQSSLPLTSLVFLLPLLILYEVGTGLYAIDPVSHLEQRIIAFSLLQKFAALFGANGRYIPAIVVAVILLAWHIARNDPWSTHFGCLSGMLMESAMWALPLLATGMIFAHYIPLASPTGQWRALIVLSLGAGIYEELAFRLVALTVLNIMLVDLLRIEKTRALWLMVGVSAIGFSAYHYLGNEPYDPRTFIFRALAGIYFAVLFLWRGFGVTAGSHAAYDISTVLLRVLAHS